MRQVIAIVGVLGCVGCGVSRETAAPPLDVALDTFTIEPQSDQVYCQWLPPDGRERWLSRFVIDLGPGSHHLLVFRVADDHTPAYGPRPCDQLDLPMGVDGMLPGAQQPHSELTLPDGVAMRLGAGDGLFIQAHFLDASAQPLTAEAHWHADTVAPSHVRQQAAMLFYSQWHLSVPPGLSTQAATCPAPAAVSVVAATGHMHRHGTAFDATVGGRALFHSDSWAEPGGAVFAPPFSVGRGEPITWACSYENDGAQPIVFGPSATANEMCILAGIFYPSSDGNTDWGCD